MATTSAASLGSVASPADMVEVRKNRKGRIKQSVAFWCFNARGDKWSAEKTCQVAKELGCLSVELIDPEHWPALKKQELICAIASNGMPGTPFMQGSIIPSFRRRSSSGPPGPSTSALMRSIRM